jgi:hypothetical protein
MTGNGSVNSGIQSFLNIQSVDPSYQAVGAQHNVI